MAAEDRGAPPALKNAIMKDARHYSFIQAMRLLLVLARSEKSSAADADGTTAALLRRTVRTRPQLSLDFPGTDIVSVEASNPDDRQVLHRGIQYLITVTFLGLYGSSSPLPNYYTEDLLSEAMDDLSVTRDFLDIINAPLYPLLYQCWSKYRLGVKILEEKDQPTLERLYCLLGFGGKAARQTCMDGYGLLRYIGLFTQNPRSAVGLRALLSDALNEDRMDVVSCVARRARIPGDQLCRLGHSGNRLGRDTYAGDRIEDRMGKFRIRIGPLDWAGFHEWLPDTPRFARMAHLIRLYVDQPLEWDIELLISGDDARTASLGEGYGSRLGWDTRLSAAEEEASNGSVSVIIACPKDSYPM
jgi:type VI secretion system protein ImpH